MTEYFKSRVKAFHFALSGLWLALRTEKNIWIYLVITIAVVITAARLRLSVNDWAVIILTIAFVWAAELINTAIEYTVDLITPERHPIAKAAKDIAAAAVLITAIASLLIGLLILGPPLWAQIIFFLSH